MTMLSFFIGVYITIAAVAILCCTVMMFIYRFEEDDEGARIAARLVPVMLVWPLALPVYIYQVGWANDKDGQGEDWKTRIQWRK